MRISLLSAGAALLVLLAAAPSVAAASVADDWIEAEYDLRFPAFDRLNLTGDLEVRRLLVDGERYEADELRDAYRAARAAGGEAGARTFLASVERAFAALVRANVEAAFPGAETGEPWAHVDVESLRAASDRLPNEPPVLVEVATAATLDLGAFGVEGYGADDVAAVLDVGASVEIPLTLVADPGHENRFVVHFPEGIVARAAPGAERLGDAVAWRIDNTGSREPATVVRDVVLADGDVQPPADTEGTVEILVDIQDLDVTIAGAAGGDFGSMVMEIGARGRVDTLELPEAVRAQLPPNVHLDSIDADGVRTLVARGLVSDAQLERAAGDLADTLGARIAAALGAPATNVRASWIESSIASAAPGAPLEFEARADVVRPLAAPVASQGAALALYSMAQSLPLQRLEGYDTVYTVVFPPGIALESASSDGAEVSTRTREDGRHEMRVEMVGEDAPEHATVQTQIAVTPTFVVAKFWPVLLLVAAVLLVVLVGIVRLFRRKR